MARQKAIAPDGAGWVPATCSKADLAAIFGISIRSVTDWDQKGVFKKSPSRGRFETMASIHGYISALRVQASGRASSTGKSLSDERAESERIARQIQSLKLAQMKGEVLTLEEVEASWSVFATAVRSMVLALPGQARSSIPHLTAHDAEVLKTICRDKLRDLADEVEAAVISGDPEELGRGA